MSDLTVPSSLTRPGAPKADAPAKIRGAAEQFEALLIGQILQASHQSGGWLGTGEDAAGGCAIGFAEEQLAGVMARSGGFGLAKLIAQGLESH